MKHYRVRAYLKGAVVWEAPALAVGKVAAFSQLVAALQQAPDGSIASCREMNADGTEAERGAVFVMSRERAIQKRPCQLADDFWFTLHRHQTRGSARIEAALVAGAGR